MNEETKTTNSTPREKAAAKVVKASIDTPLGWARKKGQIRALTMGNGTRVALPSTSHAAAAQLHGWNDHRHHAGVELGMTEEAYEAALVAAARPVKCEDGRSRYVPYEAACSEYAPYKRAKNVPGPTKETG